MSADTDSLREQAVAKVLTAIVSATNVEVTLKLAEAYAWLQQPGQPH